MATLICVVDHQCSAMTLSVWKKSVSCYMIPGILLYPIKYMLAPISSILIKPCDMNSLTLLDALCPMAYTLYSIKYT